MTTSDERRTIIIGSGIAGLSLALRLGSCTVITKSDLGSGASELAQGGLAAALGEYDSTRRHADDTITVGRGLADVEVARLVTDGAPSGISWLRDLGTRFDTDGGQLDLGREAGHSRHRIVHAQGDASGKEVMRALTAEVARRRDIEVLAHAHVLDILHDETSAHGVLLRTSDGEKAALFSSIVVLATGGIGQVYSRTTNPTDATGDGLAMAWRAGAAVRDVEFVQFHPTALDSGVNPRPLLTEALRGAGAVLLDQDGRRFMLEIHEDAELAPRDVVARAIWAERQRAEVFLDARGVPDVAQRFPTARQHAADAGFDIVTDPLPVAPAQHFHMGGVSVDHQGRSTLQGLFALGEVASTGFHGANRLASNSLVEGVVFGRVVAEVIDRQISISTTQGPIDKNEILASLESSLGEEGEESSDVRAGMLQELMWCHGGIVRSHHGLLSALAALDDIPSGERNSTLANLLTVSELILRSAFERTESRGAHFRSDHPAADEQLASPIVRRPAPSIA